MRGFLLLQYLYQNQHQYQYYYEKLSLASMPRFFLASAAVSPLEFACNDDGDYEDEDGDDDGDDEYDDADEKEDCKRIKVAFSSICRTEFPQTSTYLGMGGHEYALVCCV